MESVLALVLCSSGGGGGGGGFEQDQGFSSHRGPLNKKENLVIL